MSVTTERPPRHSPAASGGPVRPSVEAGNLLLDADLVVVVLATLVHDGGKHSGGVVT